MYLCEMAVAKQHILKYMVIQCSKLFHLKVSGRFLRQHSQSSYNIGKIQNEEGLELPEEKNLVFQCIKISYFNFTYIFALVLGFIS